MINGLNAFYSEKHYKVDNKGYILRIYDGKVVDVFARTQLKFKLKKYTLNKNIVTSMSFINSNFFELINKEKKFNSHCHHFTSLYFITSIISYRQQRQVPNRDLSHLQTFSPSR